MKRAKILLELDWGLDKYYPKIFDAVSFTANDGVIYTLYHNHIEDMYHIIAVGSPPEVHDYWDLAPLEAMAIYYGLIEGTNERTIVS
jgi:hypothetical protein